MSNFKRDYRLGKFGETIVLNILKKKNLEVELNSDKETRKYYDIVGKIDKKKFTIECKLDWMAQRTGNLALEYRNCKKDEPSGIEVTKANLWAHVVLDNDNPTAWITSVKKLKEYIKAHKPWKVVERAGDGNASLYLYRDTEILYAIFHRIDIVEENELKKIFKELLKK